MIWARVGLGLLPGRGRARARSQLLEDARAADPGGLPVRTFSVVDRAAASHHRALLPASEAEIVVDGAESSKTIGEAERVLGELARAGARRDDLVLAFGGGVVGDLAGFCAATYQRGVPVVQAPTTLVSQVDSAYGGKTGVDLPEAKNYVGAYHQPLAVLADPATLATLPPEELAAGFVEVVKTALIAGGPLWERVRSLESLDPASLQDVIFACARTKIEVVASDERDDGRRAVLNLGHTVGHAIETVTGYGHYRHGEAVGLGLLAALRLSGADELRAEVAALLDAHGLPTELDASADPEEVVAAISRDKKASADGVGFVLLAEPGEPRWGERVEADRVLASRDRAEHRQLMASYRVEILHGVNFDMLGARDPHHYGGNTLPELELKIKRFANDLGLEATFFQTNHEGEYVERLHRLPEKADAAIVNPGAWTHYSYAIRDALEFSGVPAVEIHLSDISKREEFRKVSVFEGLDSVIGRIYGKQADGYREALELIATHLGSGSR